ncbi:UNVERIFIED_CONTAM: hypothetical protein FKN15_050941 [Acipenser sinensis]
MDVQKPVHSTRQASSAVYSSSNIKQTFWLMSSPVKIRNRMYRKSKWSTKLPQVTLQQLRNTWAFIEVFRVNTGGSSRTILAMPHRLKHSAALFKIYTQLT